MNPEFLKKFDFKGKTNLKGIEGHKLKALINEDLSIYEPCLINEIHQRIGGEIPIRKIKAMLNKMILQKELTKVGLNRWTKYSLNKVS